jgi:hypothetical protein
MGEAGRSRKCSRQGEALDEIKVFDDIHKISELWNELQKHVQTWERST